MATTTKLREKELELDEDGYLKDIDAWDVRVAEHLAKLEGMKELTGEHWKLITAIRFHYEKHGESPLCRDILKEAGYTKNDMYQLFRPLGYKSAFKLAGLPKPIEC